MGLTAAFATVVFICWVAIVPDKYDADAARDATLWWEMSRREYAKYGTVTAGLWLLALAFRLRCLLRWAECMLVAYAVSFAVCATWSVDRWAAGGPGAQ